MAKDRLAGKRKRKPKEDEDNPLELGRSQGVRRPEWLLNAENGEHDEDQVEFMKAMEEFKKKNNKPFPTWSEVLHVIKSLGYRKPEHESKLDKYLKKQR